MPSKKVLGADVRCLQVRTRVYPYTDALYRDLSTYPPYHRGSRLLHLASLGLQVEFTQQPSPGAQPQRGASPAPSPQELAGPQPRAFRPERRDAAGDARIARMLGNALE